MSLKERMDECYPDQVYNHSQFENLRKFWDLGANMNNPENVEKNTTINKKKSRPFNSQQHKEFSDIKSSGKDTHEIDTCLSQKNVLAKEEIEKLNPKCIPHVLPGETTFPLRTSRKSTHQLPGNESSKENVEKNTKWLTTSGFKEENAYLDREIQESIVKTSVLSKDYEDTFNDSLQKLLSEVSSSAIQLSGGKVHGKQVLEPGVSGYRTRLQNTDFSDPAEVARGPKEIIDEHVDKTVSPPKVRSNTLTVSLDKLLREATGTSPSPLQIKLEPMTSRANSELEESSTFEKQIEGSHGTAACQRENFPQGMASNQYAQLAPQDKSLYPQREVSETVEKVIFLSKPPLKDVNAILQKLHREAWLTGREKEELNEVVQATSSPQNYLGDTASQTTQMSPSVQTLSLSCSTVTQYSRDLPQEVAEIVRATVIQPKSEFLEFSAGLERLLKETIETPSSKYESYRGSLSPSELKGSEEEPSPVLKTLERSAARKMPCKSLEDLPSDSSNQAKVNNLPEELVHSAEDVSTVPSQPDNQFSHPDKLKRMSKSVPAFLQDESDGRETDTASESSYQLSRHKKSPSSLTNLSSSSGMTSLSSVSGSVMSLYSGDFGNLEVKGSIQFAIDYVDSLKELHVFVAQCKDLAAADTKKQRSDPYVKSYLLPDKDKMGKKKTLVVKKTLNPVYNEILRYNIEKQVLKTQKLNLSVWHRDTFKRNSFLGEVELDLEAWDWENKQDKQLKWYPLKQKTAPVAHEAENRGEMKLALQYVPEPNPGKKLPTTGEVHIWVKECLDLPLLRGSHLNSFVRCTILPDTSRKSRQKTRAVGRTTNPVFNHTMVYDGFRPEDLMEACVELTVWDHYKLTNQFLGGLRIGFGTGKSYGTEVDWMDSTSEEVALWEKMVNSPNTWIEATLPLRMLLIAKISK
ncbi:PREDICTED: synaptotagmin-like protein 2 isoform X2 [Condylura cristata]|uniref:synaptotagmin-like protein 2 isoform X2 n=1 Tax=Condylura cristata TaxID=143302 RepID=UPI0006430C6E|nr:PREDICTED: synaptotagmin-like protein 2 isoform X2 [Condylura cristata]